MILSTLVLASAWAWQSKLTQELMEEYAQKAQAKLKANGGLKDSDTKPNFILIYPDDFGWNDAYYNEGLTPFETTNLDYIANYGAKLTNYYTAPGCTAARCAILTGRNNMRNGCHEAGGEDDWALNLNEVLIPEMLKESDYYSVMYGKWHIGYYSWEHHPSARGFDEYRGFLGGGVGHFDHMDGNSYDWWDGVNIDAEQYGIYQPFVVNNAMYDLIQARASGELDQPFFAMLPMLLPHGNYEAPDAYIEPFEDEWGEGSNMALWLAEMYVLDELIGNMTQYCADAGILENTYIMFFGDHAADNYSPDEVPYSRSYPFYGWKGTIWEGGVRTPAVIYNPSYNVEIDVPTSVNDVFPTIAELAYVSTCDMPTLDGISLVPYIVGGDQSAIEDRMLLINIDPDCGGCGDRRRGETNWTKLKERLEAAKIVRDPNLKIERRTSDWNVEGKDSGPSAAIRYQNYKLMTSCVDWDGDETAGNGYIWFFDLDNPDGCEYTESDDCNLYDGGIDSDHEDVFDAMLEELITYVQYSYPNCPDYNEGAYCPDCSNDCGTGTAYDESGTAYDTVRPWTQCTPDGYSSSYGEITWSCASACVDVDGSGSGPDTSNFISSNRYSGAGGSSCTDQNSYDQGGGSGPSPGPSPTPEPSDDPAADPSDGGSDGGANAYNNNEVVEWSTGTSKFVMGAGCAAALGAVLFVGYRCYMKKTLRNHQQLPDGGDGGTYQQPAKPKATNALLTATPTTTSHMIYGSYGGFSNGSMGAESNYNNGNPHR